MKFNWLIFTGTSLLLLGLILGLPNAVAGLESTWQTALEWLSNTIDSMVRAWYSLTASFSNLASILAPQMKKAFFAFSCIFFIISTATALLRLWAQAKFYAIVATAFLTIAAVFAGAWELSFAVAGIVLIRKGLSRESLKQTCVMSQST